MVDLTVGCSSGGLIALSKFMLRVDAETCKTLFQVLAKKVLSPTRRKRLLRSWLSDGMYDAGTLEDALKEHYNPTRRMFDTPQACISSGKVAVTASEIKVGAPFIFTNYNGAAPHRAESGSTAFPFSTQIQAHLYIAYGRLRPDSESEPFVWQV
jgi:hypothetical protein